MASSSARSTAPVPAASAAEDLDRAVPLERVRERPRDALDGHVAAEPAEREERRAGRRGAQAAARLEQGRELARDGRGEVGVALDQLVEALARQPQQRRVADRLDGRRAGRAGQEGELADRGAGAEDAQRPAVGRDGAEAAAQDDVELARLVALAERPVAREHAQGLGLGRERGERDLVGAREQRHVGEDGPRDTDRAHRPTHPIGRSYAVSRPMNTHLR